MILVVLVVLLFVVERRYWKGYVGVLCSHMDRVAIDHAIMVLHMYAQVSEGQRICLGRKVVERGIFTHYPKPVWMTKGWWFHPIYGEVGFRGWEKYFMFKRCMVGYIAVNRAKRLITLAFRNTRNLPDWLHNFDMSFARNEMFGYGGRLHVGYTKIFASFVKRMDALLNEVIGGERDAGGYSVLLTGHSLGGALATLAALYLIGHERFGRTHIRLVTFGAPYVGLRSKKEDFTGWMRGRVDYIRCFERSTDMVPLLPKFLKVQAQKRLWRFRGGGDVAEPVPPGDPIILFHYHASRLNFRSNHYIIKYREAIYKELNLPYRRMYKHFL